MSLSTFCYMLSAFELLLAVPMLLSPGKTAEWFFKLKDDEVTLRLIGALFFVICFVTVATALTGDAAIGLNVAGLICLVACLGGIAAIQLSALGRVNGWHE